MIVRLPKRLAISHLSIQPLCAHLEQRPPSTYHSARSASVMRSASYSLKAADPPVRVAASTPGGWIRRFLGRHLEAAVEMNEHLTRPLSDSRLQRRAAHVIVRGLGNCLKQLAASLGWIAPNLNAIQIFCRAGSPSAAFSDRVARLGACANKIDAAPMFHCCTRSYCGFHPREMPLLISEDAMKS